MLAYITKMSQTLLEAAQYLCGAPEEGLREELLDNGRQMLAQIRAVLEQHRDDLRSEAPLDKLSEIEDSWQAQSDGLEAELEQFIRCLPNEITYQVRAVFFAELGEKWDAMQSAYEYMRDDPRFDPVVVRTPVGRVVNRNGKQKQEIIYRDFLTPMGIPSLGYDRYDIEKDCPELAFISQPYESCTMQEFWPENIAKHTRLVYLPYFLPNEVSEESIQPLAQLPVYRFAWKAVCPTEKQYKFYCRYAENKGTNALVTGAPKSDAFVAIRQHGVQRPKKWAKLDEKTIFLWNSWYDIGISSLRYFEKIMEWFNTHEECGLIWRPHPMTDTVTKLYYPKQYNTYQKCVRQAEMAQNVVVDQESSCAAAFSVSHAMISDGSSLLPQYLILDKPALWIRNEGERDTGGEFVDHGWMEQASQISGVFKFMEDICQGKDNKAKQRKIILQQDLPLADGHCGERVCETIWSELHQEDHIPNWQGI